MTGPVRPHARARATEVRAEDLDHLAALHGILAALNDPGAGVDQLRKLCKELPSLSARLVEAAEREAPRHDIRDLGVALAILGNAGLEAVLLPFLEDLTILKADLEDAKKRRP